MTKFQNIEYYKEINTKILISLRKIIRAVNIHSKKLNSQLSITTPQILCLIEISQKNDITLSDLSKNVNLSLSTVNGIIERLKKKDLVTVKKSDTDKRKISINIMPNGKTLIDSAPQLLQKQLIEGLANLSTLELSTIALSLDKIVKLMEISNLDASPNLISEINISNSSI
jgi:DNA-binding MarR family transcriptional regulator